MAVSTYDKGDVLRVTGTYTTILGAAIDPTVVKFSVKDPAGTVTTYVYLTDAQLVREASGVYYADVRLTSAGQWFVRHWSTGTGEAAAEQSYFVKPGAF